MRRVLPVQDEYALQDILVCFLVSTFTANGANGLLECSAKHNRGVSEVFYEAARVSLATKGKDSGGCIIM